MDRSGMVASVLDDAAVAAFVDSWRITDDESIFTYAEGQSTATFTQRGFPRVPATPKYMTLAEECCGGLPEGFAKERCIYDVSMTGDRQFAVSYQDFAQRHAAITKPPATNILIGKGQPVEVHYDGTKGDGLSYQLYYADDSGSVHPMSGGTFVAKGAGVFSADIKVYNSSADKRPGFMEVITVSGAGINAHGQITGKNVVLGMYPVRLEVAE